MTPKRQTNSYTTDLQSQSRNKSCLDQLNLNTSDSLEKLWGCKLVARSRHISLIYSLQPHNPDKSIKLNLNPLTLNISLHKCLTIHHNPNKSCLDQPNLNTSDS